MKRYSAKEKTEALALANQIGVKAAQEKLGVSVQTIYKWKKDAKKPTALKTTDEESIADSQSESIQNLVSSDDDAIASIEALQSENSRLLNENINLRSANRKLRSALSIFIN